MGGGNLSFFLDVLSTVQGVLVIRAFGLRIFGSTRLRKFINIKKKMFGLLRVHGYTRILAGLKHELFDLRCVIQLYTIFGCNQAKFSFYTIHGLHGAFRNVTPRVTENPLYSLLSIGRHCPAVR